MFLHATIHFRVNIVGESILWRAKINKHIVYLKNPSNVFLNAKN
jgi:hypothetical protein